MHREFSTRSCIHRANSFHNSKHYYANWIIFAHFDMFDTPGTCVRVRRDQTHWSANFSHKDPCKLSFCSHRIYNLSSPWNCGAAFWYSSSHILHKSGTGTPGILYAHVSTICGQTQITVNLTVKFRQSMTRMFDRCFDVPWFRLFYLDCWISDFDFLSVFLFAYESKRSLCVWWSKFGELVHGW